jgi:hypothetical protein
MGKAVEFKVGRQTNMLNTNDDNVGYELSISK